MVISARSISSPFFTRPQPAVTLALDLLDASVVTPGNTIARMVTAVD
jgi:hypothetical protein